jgi:3-dehydroquinate dehydratase type I
MAEASTFADVLELRLDVMERFDLKEIIESAANPVLVTYRSKREGGEGSADYETRTYYLLDAMEAGADYVDVEFSIPLEWRQKIFQMKGSCGLVVSCHLLNGTPQRDKLGQIMENMVATGADMVKIVTRARAWEDNFRVLELIPRAQAIGVGIIAFCMGPLGRISRIACPLMGGYMTFASLEKGQESASGQIPARDMKQILEMVSP